MPDTAKIDMRVEPARKAAYTAAAKREGVPLTTWLKIVADAALSAADRKSLPKPRGPGRPSNTTNKETK